LGCLVLLGSAYSGIEIEPILYLSSVQRYKRQGFYGLHSPQGAFFTLLGVNTTIITVVFREDTEAVLIRVAMAILSGRGVEPSSSVRVERYSQGRLSCLVEPPGIEGVLYQDFILGSIHGTL
jgi:hypothetical protein